MRKGASRGTRPYRHVCVDDRLKRSCLHRQGPCSPPSCRFAWFSSPYLATEAQKVMEANLELPDLNATGTPDRVREIPEFEQQDAFQTVMEWLYGRMAAGV